jgi:hypothetical protein
MKTTVEIPDGLFSEVKRYAHDHNVSMREIFETGLRKVIAEEKSHPKPFRLGKGSFRGTGMAKDYSWPELRAIAYEGRGE